MRTEEALRRLTIHQRRILDEVEGASALLGAGPETARTELGKVRWIMARMLREYQLFKHVEIFNPAITRGTPAQMEAARRMKAACIAIGHSYGLHVAHWTVEAAAANWEGYRAAMRIMIVELRTHIRRERVEIERLLAGSERTRRLAVTS